MFFLVVFSVIIIGLISSYAFFITDVTDGTNEEATVETANMKLTFSDGQKGINKALEFGGYVEKIFTLENTGSVDAMINLKWENLINTYLEGSLTYTLERKKADEETYEILSENLNVPRSSFENTISLIDSQIILANELYEYKLTIRLNYLDRKGKRFRPRA